MGQDTDTHDVEGAEERPVRESIAADGRFGTVTVRLDTAPWAR
ncbi:hypothetical protein [Streptomyces mutabilis]|nr:hypothetical protein [Streptomyces mutabilis]